MARLSRTPLALALIAAAALIPPPAAGAGAVQVRVALSQQFYYEGDALNVRITIDERSRALMGEWFPGTGAESAVASATIEATKRTSGACCAPGCCG